MVGLAGGLTRRWYQFLYGSACTPSIHLCVIRVNSPLTIYRSAAELHSEIDYSDEQSVKAGNQASDTMRSLAENELEKNELLTLLDEDHPSAVSAAIHVLEFKETNKKEERRAISLIKTQIKKGGVNAMGLRMWLNEYKSNKK